MNILPVIAHGRRDSLTHAAAEAFAEGARAQGHTVELADLVAEGFDPVLRAEDEPDWNDPGKTYSLAVRREMERIERNQATADEVGVQVVDMEDGEGQGCFRFSLLPRCHGDPGSRRQRGGHEAAPVQPLRRPLTHSSLPIAAPRCAGEAVKRR